MDRITRHGILVQVLMNRHVLNDGSKAQCDLPTNIWRTIAIVIEGIQIARLGYHYRHGLSLLHGWGSLKWQSEIIFMGIMMIMHENLSVSNF